MPLEGQFDQAASSNKPIKFATPQKQWTPSGPSLHHRSPMAAAVVSPSRRLESQQRQRRELLGSEQRPRTNNATTSSLPPVPVPFHTTQGYGTEPQGDGGTNAKQSPVIKQAPSSPHNAQQQGSAITIEAWPEYRPSVSGGGFMSVRAVSPGNSWTSFQGDGGGYQHGEMSPWAFALTERVRWLEQQHQVEKESVFSPADRAKAK